MTNWENIKAGIFAGESGGDYNALFGYSNRDGGKFAGRRVTDMTLDDALAFADPSGPYGQWVKGQVGRVATPMGAYQVVGTTLRAAKDALGLTGVEKLTPEMQDRIGQWIYATQGTGAWEGYKGPASPRSTQTAQTQPAIAPQEGIDLSALTDAFSSPGLPGMAAPEPPPQMMPRNAQPYAPQKRDVLAQYMNFFKALG
jgi:hypothetical protein